jgi:hypothetical protein
LGPPEEAVRVSTTWPDTFIAAQAVSREMRADVPASFDDALCEHVVDLAIENGAVATGRPEIRWTEVTEANLGWAQAATRVAMAPGDWVARVRVPCRREEYVGRL